MPKLAEILPNWLNFAQIGTQKTNHGSKLVVEIELCLHKMFIQNYFEYWKALVSCQENEKYLMFYLSM
jgi:hypothetical protein